MPTHPPSPDVYPSSPEMLAKLGSVVRDLVTGKGVQFVCDGEECSAEMGLEDGLLPLWLWRASHWWEEVWARPLPMQFVIKEDALLGVVAKAPPMTASIGAWALFVDYAIDEWIGRHPKLAQQNSPVPLDDLFQEWLSAIDNKRLALLQAGPSPTPVPAGGLRSAS